MGPPRRAAAHRGASQSVRMIQNCTAIATARRERIVAAVTPAGRANFSIEFLPDSRNHGFAYPERRGARVWLASHASYPQGLAMPRRLRSRNPQPAPGAMSRMTLESLE